MSVAYRRTPRQEAKDESGGASSVPLRVVAADDSYLIREAIGAVLGSSERVALVALCEDGDSLWDISVKYRSTVQKLKDLNGRMPSILKAGTRIRVK